MNQYTRTAVRWFLIGTLIGTIVALALPVNAQVNPEENDPAYWGANCFKVEFDGDARFLQVDADYALVVIKAATINHTFYDVRAGDILPVPQGISHVIYCEEETPSTTSTTAPPVTTTTSTVPPQSTTTTTLPTQSTTTTVPSVTQTTTPSTSTSFPPAVPTTVTVTTLDELPYTGMGQSLAMIGGSLLLLGVGLLFWGRYSR